MPERAIMPKPEQTMSQKKQKTTKNQRLMYNVLDLKCFQRRKIKVHWNTEIQRHWFQAAYQTHRPFSLKQWEQVWATHAQIFTELFQTDSSFFTDRSFLDLLADSVPSLQLWPHPNHLFQVRWSTLILLIFIGLLFFLARHLTTNGDGLRHITRSFLQDRDFHRG